MKYLSGYLARLQLNGFAPTVLKDPERLRRDLDEMLAREHSPSTCSVEEEKRKWLKKLSGIERQKDRLLDLYLNQEVEKERYEVKRRELDRAAETVEAELERIKNRESHIKQLECDRDTLLEAYARIVLAQPL